MSTFKQSNFQKNALKSNYIDALKDPDFTYLINKLDISEKEAMLNTTKLQNTVLELRNCRDCKSLTACKNKELGCVNYPKKYNDHLVFSYVACSYKKKQIKKEQEKLTQNKILNNASMKDIDITDKNLVKCLFKDFIKRTPFCIFYNLLIYIICLHYK